MTVIDAQAVSKRFHLRHNSTRELKVRFLGFLRAHARQAVEDFWALKNVSLQVRNGDAVALVGRNGSGKSTFLKLVAAIHRPTSGRLLIRRDARIVSMIELGVGFHPELTGRENVYLNSAIHGLSGAEIDEIYPAIVDYSGLQHFIDVPIKNYSSGMHMRLGFAIAANLNPDILLLDEIFAVGDADFQIRCIDTVKRFLDQGKTLMFVSHAPAAVRAVCQRVCVLDQGELLYDGDVEGGLAFYDRLSLSTAELTPAPRVPVSVAADEEALNRAPHRFVMGALWRETGQWQYEFLRRQGLRADHYVLDVGCGSLNLAVHLLPFLEHGRYTGVDQNRALLEAGLQIELPRANVSAAAGHYVVTESFDLTEVAHPIDFAIASSLFPYLPFNSVARCISSVVHTLAPTGRFYASWFENPNAGCFEPIRQSSGSGTYSDREPYHYPFNLVQTICDAVGAQVARVDDAAHPRGESMLVFTRRSSR